MPPRKGAKKHHIAAGGRNGRAASGKECRVVSSERGAMRGEVPLVCSVRLPRGAAPRGIYRIHTDLMFTNSRMPYSESSRP